VDASRAKLIEVAKLAAANPSPRRLAIDCLIHHAALMVNARVVGRGASAKS
jgi:hypothetical protein